MPAVWLRRLVRSATSREPEEWQGAEFAGPVEEQDYGNTVMLKVPGADIMLYELRHPTAYDLD